MATDRTSVQSDISAAENPEQDAISPALRRRLQKCFEHGTQQFKQLKCDHDYANTMFTECVVHDPGNLVYVEAYLDNLQRKYKDNKKGAAIKGFGGKGAFKKALAHKEWREVLKLGPEQLKTNPWDVPTLRGMAEACAGLHYNEIELRYLKNALDARLKDRQVNRHCALSLARMGQFDQAIACWHRIEEIKRYDAEAAKMISELSVRRTQHMAGMDEEGHTATGRVVLDEAAPQSKPEPQSEPEKQEPPAHREVQLTPRQQLEHAIQQEPAEINNYLRLAELLCGERRYAEAEPVLSRALSVSGGDPQIRERLEDAQIGRAHVQVSIAEKRASVQQTEESQELVGQMREQLNRLELDIYQQRNERHPAEARWKFELGVRLKRAGNYKEAIKLLQQVQGDPRQQAAAVLELGESFQHLKKYQQALDYYQQAAQLTAQDDPQRHKLAHYRAGVLATGLKDLDRAQQHLMELSRLDPDYRDVAARLDKIRKIRDKE